MKYKGNLSLKLYNKKMVNRIQKKINLLGVSCKYDAITFLNVRIFTSIIIFLVVLIFLLMVIYYQLYL